MLQCVRDTMVRNNVLGMAYTRAISNHRYFPLVLGLGSVVAAIALIEVLIRLGVINRFIVPMPSEIFWAFPRIIREEDVLVPRCALDWWRSANAWRTMGIAASWD